MYKDWRTRAKPVAMPAWLNPIADMILQGYATGSRNPAGRKGARGAGLPCSTARRGRQAEGIPKLSPTTK
jgi:hypothetical protein